MIRDLWIRCIVRLAAWWQEKRARDFEMRNLSYFTPPPDPPLLHPSEVIQEPEGGTIFIVFGGQNQPTEEELDEIREKIVAAMALAVRLAEGMDEPGEPEPESEHIAESGEAGEDKEPS